MAKEIKVNIQFLDGRTSTLEVMDNMLLWVFKEKIKDKEKINRHHQRLIFDGKELIDNGLALSDYKIQDGATLLLFVAEEAALGEESDSSSA